ncbi:hypothetical protein [Streptomyces sp. NPDC046332]|uniref:hypothetical protein n=1 Tax=Streptomyces sp. NPDC046332 TaxID=3155133 RepID=UPI0033D6012A
MAELVADGRAWDVVDGPSLVRCAAGLQLMRENIPCLVRLQRLAAVGAGLPRRPDAPPLSPSRLRSLLKEPVIGDEIVRAQEDPYGDLYTAEVAFHGGPYLIAQGLAERSAYTISLMLRSVFGPAGAALPSGYRVDAGRLAQALLRLSHSVLRRANLPRGVVAPAAMRKDILVPGASALATLCEAVTFTEAELTAIASPRVLGSVDSLRAEPGSHVLTSDPGPDDGLILTPLLNMGTGLIVANPSELATALRHQLIVLAGRHGCRSQLARLLREGVLSDTTEILVHSGATPVAPMAAGAVDAQISRRQFTFADDKSIDLTVVADDLSDYDGQEPHGFWDAGRLVQRAQDLVDPPGKGKGAGDAQCLRLIICQGVGRASGFGLREPVGPGPLLATTADDLRVMAELDGTDPLFLWRFAQADAKLAAAAYVHSFSKLDNYGLYRDHDYSFYLSDEDKPNAVMVNSDFSDALRVEAYRRFDHHVVISPHRRALVPVVAVYGVDTAPIYRTHPSVPEDELLVESAGMQVWVGPGEEAVMNALEALRDTVLEAVAYWTWQFALVAPQGLRAAADDDARLRVIVSFDDQRAWQVAQQGNNGGSSSGQAPWIDRTASEPGLVRLQLMAAGAQVLLAKSNEADRMIVRCLAEAAARQGSGLSADLIVDQVAPYGPKKMLHAIANPLLLQPGNLPSARLVQPAVSAAVLDEMGEWLVAQGFGQGPVPASERLGVLNKAVEYAFQQVKDLTATLSPAGLMLHLMARHEALLRADALNDHVLSSRVACFGAASQPAVELADENSRRVLAAQASRFLVEYTAATPPSGDAPLTLDVYDTLLAVAAELIARATLSDAIRYDFSTAQLSMLGSGRLGVSRGDRFESGTRALAVARARSALLGPAEEAVTPKADDTGAPSTRVEEAMHEEFGLTLTELAHGIGEVITLGRASGEPCALPTTRVQQHLRGALGWTGDKADAFLDHLSLRPRPQFLSVKAQAWPWRFNREWSYARRPLVRLSGADGELLAWAPRHLWNASRYWVNLVYSGRLKVSSPTMKKLMGSIRQDHNKDFEESARLALARAGCSITAHSVSKIAGRRLMSPQGHDLGDIDALGINREAKKIFVVEAKDFEMARNPFELANEADALFRGDKSATFKIERRAQWIRTHLPLTLSHFGIDSPLRGWSVIPVVVTSRDLMAAHVLLADVPVLDIYHLTSWVRRESAPGRAVARRTRQR